ncbi:MAG: SDR family oxidoreductase [Candidatus Sericytochromatia bacterium]|nr:SDR family oxidoreductase [Candidatus Tanganyikabacteria bacterium]
MARTLVAGGAGFVGSHLVDALLAAGESVVVLDNLCTGRRENLEPALATGRCTLVEADISDGLPPLDTCQTVWHLASPASPPDYGRLPIETLRVGAEGTRHLLEAAHRWQARFLVASTSEVYGDPQVHPQPETYWGHVNPIGWRSCYDEAKRYAEALTMAYHRAHGVDTRIVRIFNTYGPRMRADDGRVVSNFLCQALAGKPLTLYGTGDQTRSFQYVSDLVAGLLAWMDRGDALPANLGNPGEFTIRELADAVDALLGRPAERAWHPLPPDDPRQRKPDIDRARTLVGWQPVVPLAEGLARTAEWFRHATGRPA